MENDNNKPIIPFYKNYGFWCSLAAFIYLLGTTFGFIKLDQDTFGTLVTSALAVVVIAGFVNNPNEGKWYKNNKENE